MTPDDPIAPHAFTRLSRDAGSEPVQRPLAREMPIAIEFNGIGYAVLMATPADLVDLAHGFALTERLVDGTADIVDCDVHPHAAGTIVRVTLAKRVALRIADRVRHRVAESSCGLCGIENLEQAMRPLPRVAATFDGNEHAVFAALDALAGHQPLNRATGAVHAAAQCRADGGVVVVREDVGRHNAFDKLIGAMMRAGTAWDGGFALVTSRLSYELVEKAALAGCPLIAAISAPTDMALRRAAEAGVRVIALARPDALLVAR